MPFVAFIVRVGFGGKLCSVGEGRRPVSSRRTFLEGSGSSRSSMNFRPWRQDSPDLTLRPGLHLKPSTYFAPHRKPLICCICTYLLLLFLARNQFGYLLTYAEIRFFRASDLLTYLSARRSRRCSGTYLLFPELVFAYPQLVRGGYYIPAHIQSNPGHKNTQIWSQPGFLNPRQPGRQPASFLAEFLNHPEAEGQPAEFLIS